MKAQPVLCAVVSTTLDPRLDLASGVRLHAQSTLVAVIKPCVVWFLITDSKQPTGLSCHLPTIRSAVLTSCTKSRVDVTQ